MLQLGKRHCQSVFSKFFKLERLGTNLLIKRQREKKIFCGSPVRPGNRVSAGLRRGYAPRLFPLPSRLKPVSMAKNTADKYSPRKGDVVDGARNLLKAPLNGASIILSSHLKSDYSFFLPYQSGRNSSNFNKIRNRLLSAI